MKENQTVNYYNQWAERYCSETLHVDMSFCRKKFLSYLGTKGKILDAGIADISWNKGIRWRLLTPQKKCVKKRGVGWGRK